jgi:hypothetical protein
LPLKDMATAEAFPLITSPDIEQALAVNRARLMVDAPALGKLATDCKAETPDRLIVVTPEEMVTHLQIMNIQRPEEPRIIIQRHSGPYATKSSVSGHVVSESTGDDHVYRDQDLVVVTPSLWPTDLHESTARSLLNHPYLNRVAHRDEATRRRLDRWMVWRGGGLGFVATIGGGMAEYEGVPYMDTVSKVGFGLCMLAVIGATYTRNWSPRRAPMPDLTNRRSPLYLVSEETGDVI